MLKRNGLNDSVTTSNRSKPQVSFSDSSLLSSSLILFCQRGGHHWGPVQLTPGCDVQQCRDPEDAHRRQEDRHQSDLLRYKMSIKDHTIGSLTQVRLLLRWHNLLKLQTKKLLKLSSQLHKTLFVLLIKSNYFYFMIIN